MSQNTPKTERLFIGGLFDEVTPEDLKERFAKYGVVKSVDLKTKRNTFGEVVKTFAFMDFDSTPAKLKQCIDVFNKAKWKGKELKIQLAEESFLDKLAKERQMQSMVKLWSPEPNKTGDNEEPHLAIQQLKVKGPPGTAIEGKEGWVLGKYSQPVPVLKVKRDNGKKTVIFDPSKNCHGLKRFDKDDDVPKISLDRLTWQLEEKQLPAKAATLKPSKSRNKQTAKKKMSEDSDCGSDTEGDFSKTLDTSSSFVATPARQKDDSDNESRGSCDTDEIIRRAKSGKYSNCKDEKKQEVMKSSPSANVKSFSGSLAKIQPCKTFPLDIVAKKLIFSEFADGILNSSGPKKDSESETESETESVEDVFDLVKSGKIEKLFNTSQSQPSQSKHEKVNVTKVISELGTGEMSRKRKKNQSESPALVIAESSTSSETTEVPRKRKRTQLELESKVTVDGSHKKIQQKATAQSSSASVTSEKSKKRKIDLLESENELPSSSPKTKFENGDLRSSKSSKNSADAEKSIKRKRSDLEQDKNQVSKTDSLEIKQAINCALKKLKQDETKGTVKPTKPNKQLEKSTKDLKSETEADKKGASKNSPVKELPVSEQKKSLEILRSVLPIKASQAMGFRDFQSFRYDPSAADHDKFEIHDEDQQRQKPSPIKKEAEEKQTKPVADVKKYADVDASVVDVFKTPVDAPFLLGTLFGPEESSDEEAESLPVLPNWKKPKVVVDNENDEKYENNTELKSKAFSNIENGFFYHSEDPRLKASKFCREKDMDELRAEWQEKRPHLVESYRMKKKKPLRPHGNATRPHGKPTLSKGKPHGKVFKKNWKNAMH